jgi:hypothetical protein
MKRIVLLPLLVFAACASGRAAGRTDLLQIQTTHYQSMTGVTLRDGDVATNCKRDLITGSHILRWYCTFADDPNQYQLVRRVALDTQ